MVPTASSQNAFNIQTVQRCASPGLIFSYWCVKQAQTYEIFKVPRVRENLYGMNINTRQTVWLSRCERSPTSDQQILFHISPALMLRQPQPDKAQRQNDAGT